MTAEQMTLDAARLCVLAMLGATVTLGSWPTCPTGMQTTTSSLERARWGQMHPGRRPLAASPQQRSLEVVSDLLAGMHHGEPLNCNT